MLSVRTLSRVARNYPHRLPAVVWDRLTLDRRRAARGDGAMLHGAGFTLATRTLGQLRLLAEGDVDEFREIAISNMYCARGFVPRSGWTVVDVGANVGLFSRWARSFMRDGLILAIEPLPITFQTFWGNLGLGHPLSRGGPVVLPANVAVSNRRETLELLVPHGPLGWSAAPGWTCAARSHCAAFLGSGANIEQLRVDALPMDELLRGLPPADRWRRIDLLKVDVEGMEVECFEGASLTLKIVQRVAFEYHSGELLARCAKLLQAAGLREVLRRDPYSSEMGVSFWRRRAA